MKRANTMSTITVELIIKMKTKFTSSNAENTNGFISPQTSNFHTASSASPIGVQSVRPTWFEDTTPKDTTSQSPQDPHKEQPQSLHGLKLVIREEVLPANDQPQSIRPSPLTCFAQERTRLTPIRFLMIYKS